MPQEATLTHAALRRSIAGRALLFSSPYLMRLEVNPRSTSPPSSTLGGGLASFMSPPGLGNVVLQSPDLLTLLASFMSPQSRLVAETRDLFAPPTSEINYPHHQAQLDEARAKFVMRYPDAPLSIQCLEWWPTARGRPRCGAEGEDETADAPEVIVLWLHGAGVRGDRIERLRIGGLLFWLDCETSSDVPSLHPSSPDFPFAVIAPQCPSGTEWAKPQMLAVLTHLCHRIRPTTPPGRESPCAPYDTDQPWIMYPRFVVMGPSMGGLGAYMFAAHTMARSPYAFPLGDRVLTNHIVHRVAPMCGGGKHVFARTLCLPSSVSLEYHCLPCWFFHAVDDGVIAVEDTDAIVGALRDCGHEEVRYTRYAPGIVPTVWSAQWCVGHDVSALALQDESFWAWVDEVRQEAITAKEEGLRWQQSLISSLTK